METLDPRTTPARSDLAAKHLEGRVAAERFVPGTRKQIGVPLAALRRQPRAEAPLDSELLLGERFTVYEERHGWAWGQSECDSYVGYVESAALGEPADATHRVCVPASHLYASAGIKAPIRGRLSLGCRLAVIGASDRFAEIVMPDGAGFVPLVHIAPLATTVPDYVAVAERFLCVPYVFGGRSSLGIDCSALVQLALAEAGIAAPRDSDQQLSALGGRVSDSEALAALRRGDLVFWRSHVAIALDERRIIHANAAAMAVSIDDASVFARRVEAVEGPVVSVNRLKP